MPGKQARALCPVCQEPMPPDETECRNCGAFVIDEAVVRLSRAFGIDRDKALRLFEAGFRHPKQLRDRDVDGVLKRRESGLLFLCTNCGSFVAGGDTKCARCGAEFEGGPEEPAWSEEEEDILDLILCPNCGADNGPEWTECEICGEPLTTVGTGAPIPQAPATPPVRQIPPMPAPAGEPEPDRFDELLEDLEDAMKPREPDEAPKRMPAAVPDARPALPSAVAAPARPSFAPAPPSPKVPPPTQARPPVTPIPVPRPIAPAARGPPAPPTPPKPALPIAIPKEAPAARRLVRRPAEIRVRPELTARRDPRAPRMTAQDLFGPAVAAAGVGLYWSNGIGQEWSAWAIAFALAAVTGYAIAGTFPNATGYLRKVDGLLLGAGAVLGAIAPILGSFVPAPGDSLAAGLAISSALPLAGATRRLLAKPVRDLLAAAAAVPLVVLAIASGQGAAYADGPGWSLGVLAALPWPAALAAAVVRDRVVSFAVRRELVQAERDYERQDYAKSVADYDRAIRLTERSSGREALPWYGKGAALVILGRYEEALEAIDRALDINPRNEVAWVNKGNALTKMGRLVDALRSFNAAIKVNPAYEVAWNNKGNALARLGRHEEALRCYEKSLDLDPDYRSAWVNKGYVLAKLGRFDEAAACADRVLRLEGARRAGPA